MLAHIKPEKKNSRSREATPTPEEKSLAKRLLIMGYKSQDITFIINQGRTKLINHGRMSQVDKDNSIIPSSEEDAVQYMKVQSSYDVRTLLNPYKDHRLIRAREAIISAVNIFNSPIIIFRSEIFSVLSNIAWTYLLHEKLEQTKKGLSKIGNGNSVTLNGTLDKEICPIRDQAVVANLREIIKIRDEVEHTFFVGGDCFGPLFQSCCINFNKYMTEWFGSHLSLEKELSLALQFVRLDKKQVVELEKSSLPPRIRAIADGIDSSEFKNNNAFQLNVYYTTEISPKTKSDIHHLVDYNDSDDAIVTAVKKVNRSMIAEKEVVNRVKENGYIKFRPWDHQQFWKTKWKTAEERNKKARDKYGVEPRKGEWFWYEDTWLPEVIKYCEESGSIFK